MCSPPGPNRMFRQVRHRDRYVHADAVRENREEDRCDDEERTFPPSLVGEDQAYSTPSTTPVIR